MGIAKNRGVGAVAGSGGSGGSSSDKVALIAVGSQPSTPYNVGNKWFYDGKIYTALTTTTADDGQTPAFNTTYIYDGKYYWWNGSDLVAVDETKFVHVDGDETIGGLKTFSKVVRAKTPPLDAIDNEVTTAEWVFNHTLASHKEFGVDIAADGTATRLYGAVGCSFAKSTDTEAGTDDFRQYDIFDTYDVLVKYNAITGKAELFATEGTWEFEHYRGLPGFYDFVAVKIYWYKLQILSAGNVRILVSPEQKAGYNVSPAHYRNGVLHEYVYIAKYVIGNKPFVVEIDSVTAPEQPYTVGYKWFDSGKIYTATSETETDGGVDTEKNTSYLCNNVYYYCDGAELVAQADEEPFTIASGNPPMVSKTVVQFDTLAKTRGLSLFGLKEITTLQLLATVKYASLDWQTKIGKGNTAGWKGDAKAATTETDENFVIVAASAFSAANLTVPATMQCIGVGTSDVTTWYKVLSIEDVTVDNVACKKVFIAGKVSTAANVTVICLGVQLTGGGDNVLGLDGENTANGVLNAEKRPMVNFGIEGLVGNVGQYAGNTVNKVANSAGKILSNPNPEEATANYPTTSDDKGWEVVTTHIPTTNRNNYKFLPSTDLNIDAFLFGDISGGLTGDQQYYTASAGIKRVFYGGTCNYGGNAGGFYLLCDNDLSNHNRRNGGRCVFVP